MYRLDSRNFIWFCILAICLISAPLVNSTVYALDHYFCADEEGRPISIGVDGCSMNMFGVADENFLGMGDISTFFHDDCVFHDMCYTTKGAEKSACDTEFHRRMAQRCHDNFYGDPIRYVHCKTVAESMRVAVSNGGWSAWNGWDKGFRENDCIKVYKKPYSSFSGQ